MKTPIISTLALCALLPACASVPARPVALASLTMTDGPSVAAPNGFIEMCRVSPDLCAPATNAVAVVPSAAIEVVAASAVPVAVAPTGAGLTNLGEYDAAAAFAASASAAAVGAVTTPLAFTPTPARVDSATVDKLLKAVNRKVNGAVRQRSDAAIFGTAELWRRSGIGRGATGDCEDLAIEKREQLIAAGLPRDMLFYATAYRADLGLHTVLVARTQGGDMVLDSRSPYVQLWRKLPYDWVSRQNPDAPSQWSMIVDRARPAPLQVATAVVPGQDVAALQ